MSRYTDKRALSPNRLFAALFVCFLIASAALRQWFAATDVCSHLCDPEPQFYEWVMWLPALVAGIALVLARSWHRGSMRAAAVGATVTAGILAVLIALAIRSLGVG